MAVVELKLNQAAFLFVSTKTRVVSDWSWTDDPARIACASLTAAKKPDFPSPTRGFSTWKGILYTRVLLILDHPKEKNGLLTGSRNRDLLNNPLVNVALSCIYKWFHKERYTWLEKN